MAYFSHNRFRFVRWVVVLLNVLNGLVLLEGEPTLVPRWIAENWTFFSIDMFRAYSIITPLFMLNGWLPLRYQSYSALLNLIGVSGTLIYAYATFQIARTVGFPANGVVVRFDVVIFALLILLLLPPGDESAA